MINYDSTLVEIKRYLIDSSHRQTHLIGGGATGQLEIKLKNFYGVKYALCFANATNALTTAAFLLGIRNSDVITSPFNYGASVSGLLYLDNRLIFSDIDTEDHTLCLLPDTIEKGITRKTRAVLAVDWGGVPHDMFKLREICDTYGLKYIADASQSFGALINGQPSGRLADICVTSFTTGKTLFAGEGAAIMTDSEELYEKMVWYSQHPYRQKRDICLNACNEFAFTNGRISPLSAIMANETFEKSLAELQVKQQEYLSIIEALNVSGLTKIINYNRKNLLPAFFKLFLTMNGCKSLRSINEFFKQRGYECDFSEITPIYRNTHFLSQFPGQFKKGLQIENDKIAKEFFGLTLEAMIEGK